jgi:pre-mRNA-splicing factor CWC22
MREVGAFLAENSPKANNGVFERFRAVLHEGAIDKRTQYMIEVLFQVRRDKFKDNPIIPEGLDLVEEDEQITHRIALDDELQVQEGLSKHIPIVASIAQLNILTPLLRSVQSGSQIRRK